MRRTMLPALASLLLSACVYESDVPLGEAASAPLDTALLGLWALERAATADPDMVVRSGWDSTAAALQVMRFNDHEYLLVEPADCQDTALVRLPSDIPPQLCLTYRRAFLTAVAGARFVNIQDVGLRDGDLTLLAEDDADSEPDGGESARPYRFARLELDGDVLRLVFIVENALPSFATSEALHAAVAARVEDPALYRSETDSTVRTFRRYRPVLRLVATGH